MCGVHYSCWLSSAGGGGVLMVSLLLPLLLRDRSSERVNP